MMKPCYFLFVFIFSLFSFSVKAQQLKLGSNPTQIEKSAVLELESPNQGLLLTRVPDTSNATGIDGLSPPDGMIIYFTDGAVSPPYGANAGLYMRKGGWWQRLVPEDANGIETINGDGTKDQTFTVINGNSYNNPNPPTYHEPTIVNDLAGNHILYLPYASNGFDGLVSNNMQTWVGEKRFKDPIGVESLSPGSVPFIGPDDYNYLSEDNARLFWDNTNHQLGIGTDAPTNTLTVNSGTNDESGLTLTKLKSSSPVTSGAAPIGVDANGKVVKALEYYSGGINNTLEKNKVTKIWEAEIYNTSNGEASGGSTKNTQGRISIVIPPSIGFTNILNIQVTAKGGTYTPPPVLGNGSLEQSVASIYSFDNSTQSIVISYFKFTATVTSVLGIPLLKSYSFSYDINTNRKLYIRVEGN